MSLQGKDLTAIEALLSLHNTSSTKPPATVPPERTRARRRTDPSSSEWDSDSSYSSWESQMSDEDSPPPRKSRATNFIKSEAMATGSMPEPFFPPEFFQTIRGTNLPDNLKMPSSLKEFSLDTKPDIKPHTIATARTGNTRRRRNEIDEEGMMIKIDVQDKDGKQVELLVTLEVFRDFIHQHLQNPPTDERFAHNFRWLVYNARQQLPAQLTGIKNLGDLKHLSKPIFTGRDKKLTLNQTARSDLVCQFCGKECKSRSALDIHVRTHTGERPFACDMPSCGKRFTSKAALKKHVRTHKGNRPFACDFDGCRKRFSRKDRLIVHMRSHTGEKPFACELCGKAFACRVYLNVHRRYHENLRPYVCDICYKGFVHKGDLNKHLRNVHNQLGGRRPRRR